MFVNGLMFAQTFCNFRFVYCKSKKFNIELFLCYSFFSHFLTLSARINICICHSAIAYSVNSFSRFFATSQLLLMPFGILILNFFEQQRKEKKTNLFVALCNSPYFSSSFFQFQYTFRATITIYDWFVYITYTALYKYTYEREKKRNCFITIATMEASWKTYFNKKKLQIASKLTQIQIRIVWMYNADKLH